MPDPLVIERLLEEVGDGADRQHCPLQFGRGYRGDRPAQCYREVVVTDVPSPGQRRMEVGDRNRQRCRQRRCTADGWQGEFDIRGVEPLPQRSSKVMSTTSAAAKSPAVMATGDGIAERAKTS